VLFTVPSRYWSTIGRRRYLALGGGPPRFTPDVTCPALLTIPGHPIRSTLVYGPLTLCGPPFQRGSTPPTRSGEAAAAPSTRLVQPRSDIAGRLCRPIGMGSSPFARRYSGNPLSSSGYSDVSLPPVPPWLAPGARPCAGRVAPFGFLRITGRQRLPGAFRRVAASFLGRQRLGIHHAPFSRRPSSSIARSASKPNPGAVLDQLAPARTSALPSSNQPSRRPDPASAASSPTHGPTPPRLNSELLSDRCVQDKTIQSITYACSARGRPDPKRSPPQRYPPGHC
jgi:hypothetical protein